jgi:crotonobetainyl-CoA:carnitine CoA-transferase CaiB-like acyl-CoA transferase
MKRVMTTGALSRFRVLDLSQARAGPTCVKQLADFGADVIRIEPPASVKRRELYVGARANGDMQNLHRNKRSITLDLKATGAREVLMRLVETADVVVENFRPDVKGRLGMDYSSLAALNPRVVLVSISGFGQDGPYQRRPGFDQVLQGMCGLMSTTGAPDGEPMRAGAAVIDVTAGLYAALGALTALLERESSGKGQWVQTSLLHAGIGLMDFQAARYLVDGIVPGRAGNDHPTSMPTSAYPTSDGYLNIGAGGDRMWVSLCAALSRPELVGRPEFSSDAERSKNRKELNQILGDAFRTKSTAEWLELLAISDVPAGPIYSMDQVFDDIGVRHAGIAETVEHPERGPIRLVSQVLRLERTPARIASTLEDKGGSTIELLSELGFGKAEIETLQANMAI